MIFACALVSTLGFCARHLHVGVKLHLSGRINGVACMHAIHITNL